MRISKIILYTLGSIILMNVVFAVIKFMPSPTGNVIDSSVKQSINNNEPQIINGLSNKILQNKLQNIAYEFIVAEYQGDVKTLLSLTGDEAHEAVKNGQLLRFIKEQRLEKIEYYNFIETDKKDNYQVIVAHYSANKEEKTATIAFEVLTFVKVNNEWRICKVERDA